jgi:hypothetical protein
MPTPDLPKTHLGCVGNMIPSWAELHMGRVSGFNPCNYTSYQMRHEGEAGIHHAKEARPRRQAKPNSKVMGPDWVNM